MEGNGSREGSERELNLITKQQQNRAILEILTVQQNSSSINVVTEQYWKYL